MALERPTPSEEAHFQQLLSSFTETVDRARSISNGEPSVDVGVLKLRLGGPIVGYFEGEEHKVVRSDFSIISDTEVVTFVREKDLIQIRHLSLHGEGVMKKSDYSEIGAKDIDTMNNLLRVMNNPQMAKKKDVSALYERMITYRDVWRLIRIDGEQVRRGFRAQHDPSGGADMTIPYDSAK